DHKDGFASYMDQVRAARSDAVYAVLSSASARAFLEAYDRAGLLHRIPIVLSGAEPGLVDELGKRFAGVIVSVRWSWSLEAEKSRAFVEGFKGRYDRLPSSYALQGYDAALMLADALRTANSSRLSLEAVERALAVQQVDGIEGPLRLASNGFPIT